MQITYYCAASLDGYIAREDGDISWMETLGIPFDHEGYSQFFSTVDGLLMGRKTFDMIKQFGEWPYGDKPAPSLRKALCRLQPAGAELSGRGL